MTRNDLKGKVFRVNHLEVEIIKKKGYEAVGYNIGLYGWNYDVYSINNTWVLYGYRVPLKLPKFDMTTI